MSNIKNVRCKLAGDKYTSIDSLNLSPRHGHVILVHGWMDGGTVERFSRTDELPYFLTDGAPRAHLRSAEAR